MDAGRFDALSRSLANRRSRRAALQGLGAGGLAAGLLGVLGVDRASAASGTCDLTIVATTAAGPHKNTAYSGTLHLEIGDNGAIDQGSFTTTKDGKTHPLVGQATGRALHLRITLAPNTMLELNGTADQDLILCRGAASGVFGGPGDTDIGAWRTGSPTGSTSTSSGATGGAGTTSGGAGNGNGAGSGTAGTGTTTGGGSTGSGNAIGGNGGNDASGSGGGNAAGDACASGVVCGSVCCAPASGLTPDSMVCNAGACECTYSCAAAGCPGNAQGSIVNTCGSDPQPHCHSECNAPAANGCGAMTCPDGQTLDVASCTCMPAGGGGCVNPLVNCGDAANPVCVDTQSDPNNCLGCGNACPAGQSCCGDLGCIDLSSDIHNCGACGNACAAGQSCVGGVCAAISDRAAKTDAAPIDARAVLAGVVNLPISTWRYRDEPDQGVRHLGPMAQDFAATFGLGGDNRVIFGVDGQGVALAAIQGVMEEMRQLRARLEELERRAPAEPPLAQTPA